MRTWGAWCVSTTRGKPPNIQHNEEPRPSRKETRLCRGSFLRVTFDDNPPAGHRNGQNVSKVLRGLRKLRHLRTSPTIDRNDLRLQSRQVHRSRNRRRPCGTIPRRDFFAPLFETRRGAFLVPCASSLARGRATSSRQPRPLRRRSPCRFVHSPRHSPPLV